ncbi:MAG: glycosyltransferase family 2 protein, partial [Patescibacteria group bacterium]
LPEVLKRVAAINLGEVEKEIIIVDDGSGKETIDLLKTLEEKYTIIYSPQNQGKGSAVRQGIKAASGDIILIQDGDLEYNPVDYPALIAPILSGEFQVVYGSRFLRPGNKHSKYYWGVLALTLVANLLYRLKLTDLETCYKTFRADLLKNFSLRAKRFEFEPEVTAKIANQEIAIKEVPINYCPRTVQQGKKIKLKDGWEAIFTLIKYKFIS